MAAKLIITCGGRPALNGHKRRSFLWNPELNCFVHENRKFEINAEFNEVAAKVFKLNSDLRPGVLVVDLEQQEAPVDVAALQEKIVELSENLKSANALIEELQVKETPTGELRPITLDEAMSVVQQLAPERLRKTNVGRKPDSKSPDTMEV